MIPAIVFVLIFALLCAGFLCAIILLQKRKRKLELESIQEFSKEEKEDISNAIEEQCTKIDCLSDEIDSILKQCLELKDKRQCPNCYAEIEKDVKFCPKCGTKQEEQQEEPAKEVEIVEEKNNLEKTVQVESDVDENHDETVEHIEKEEE